MTMQLLLEGTAGLFLEERHLIAPGQRLIVGRSRSCDLSAASTRIACERGRAALETDRAFRRISRRHFAICHEPAGRIIVEDLSTNGVKVAGRLVSRAVFTLDDLRDDPVAIVFGEREGVRLRVIAFAADVEPASESTGASRR
ncbi:MAG: hypothetical protein CMJ83_04515 [Planctomycetes bacterium]|nr:hypothetical protein [Planctomycetota bacterium]